MDAAGTTPKIEYFSFRQSSGSVSVEQSAEAPSSSLAGYSRPESSSMGVMQKPEYGAEGRYPDLYSSMIQSRQLQGMLTNVSTTCRSQQYHDCRDWKMLHFSGAWPNQHVAKHG